MSKEKKVTFRLEAEDYLRLEKQAAKKGYKVSKYLRHLVRFDGKEATFSSDAEQELRRYFADTSRLGSNINQIMREVNSDRVSMDASRDDLDGLLRETKPLLVSIKALLASLVRYTRI